MLIITRRSGESFFIGDEIEIVILGGGTVRVGISAPKDVEITRTELIPRNELIDEDESIPRQRRV